MANVEINELPPAVSLDGTELIAIDKNTGPGYVTQQTSLNSLSSLGVTQPYVVAQVTVGLPNSRRLAGASGQINVIDGGGGADMTIGLASNGVTPGTYGDGTHVARVTIDETGRVTSASQISITNQGDVVGPVSAGAGNVPIFSNTTGKLLSDSGKPLPAGAIVGTTDTQTLTNKSIDAAQLTGTVAYARLPVGTVASTVAAGDDSRIINALNKNNNLSDVSNPSSARANIGAAASGANFDITSLTGLTTALSISQGGTGTTTSTGTGSVVLSVSPTLTGAPTVPTAAVGTNTTQAASTAFVLAQASSTTPVMDGTGAIGVSTRFARADHVHPSDTSRLAAANNLSDVANPALAAANIGAVAVGSVNRFTATQQWAQGANIASAAALILGADGNFFQVTGTTTITSISSQPAGTQICLRFISALTLVHNPTSLFLPNGGANISISSGDAIEAMSLGSGNWVVTSYQPSTPAAMNLQGVVNLSSTAVILSTTIPTWATRITVMLGSVSLSGSAAVLVQLGNGSVETSGYQANSASIPDSISPSTLNSAVGFPVFIAGAAQSFSGAFTFTKMIDSSNTWTCTGTFTRHDGAILIVSAGRKSFSGAPTVVRITTTNGTDTFDAGNAAVSWE